MNGFCHNIVLILVWYGQYIQERLGVCLAIYLKLDTAVNGQGVACEKHQDPPYTQMNHLNGLISDMPRVSKMISS